MLHDALPTDRFLPLPDHAGQSSAARRTGVEIEFAGLSVPDTARLVQDLWGGTPTHEAEREIVLEGGQFGRVKVELDISLSKKWVEDVAAQALGDLVPVEIVTAPLAQADLVQTDHLVRELRQAGALGTQAKLAFGFGVHLNPELPGPDGAGLVAVARAYGLLENWLRLSDPLDLARRVLPFVDPWPPALVDSLAGRAGDDIDWLARIYVLHAPSRHYGLDLLPALEHLRPAALRNVPPEQLKGGRPTFHYRLPEARLDSPTWSMAYEWNRWCLIECVASLPDLLAELAHAWQVHRRALVAPRGSWQAEVEAILTRADILARMGAGAIDLAARRFAP